jgi:DNA-directed RNA polymerase subunit alpha
MSVGLFISLYIKYLTMNSVSPSVCQVISEVEISPRCHYGRFLIGPLKVGQALIYGTSIRRILLNLKGPFISCVTICKLNHEFDTMRGLHESAHEIIAQLEQITISDQGVYNALTGHNDLFSNTSQILRVQFRGPGTLTSGTLDLKQPFTIVDPNQYIAKLETSTTLDMMLSVEANKSPIISHFAPFPFPTFILKSRNQVVTNVNLNIINATTESEECLILEIWTNGSMTPCRALRLSSSIACSFYSELLNVDIKNSGGRIRTSE